MHKIFIIGIESDSVVIFNKVKCNNVRQMAQMLLKKYDDIDAVIYVKQIDTSNDKNIPYVKKINQSYYSKKMNT